jgi:hypothetical protein
MVNQQKSWQMINFTQKIWRVMSRCWQQKHDSNQQHVGAEEERKILNSTNTNGDGRNRNSLFHSY